MSGMAAPPGPLSSIFCALPGLYELHLPLHLFLQETNRIKKRTEERMTNGKMGLGLIGLGAWGNSLATAAARCG